GDFVATPVGRLEIRIVDGNPALLIISADVSNDLDLRWIDVSQLTDPGVVVLGASEMAEMRRTVALYSSGIYALDPLSLPTTSVLASLLPTQLNIPVGIEVTGEGGFQADEITRTFPDPEDAAEQFRIWGWQENQFRTFATTDGTSIAISLHRFSDPGSAADALDYFVTARATAINLRPSTISDFGDQVAAIEGRVAGGHEVSLYIRQDEVLARITVVTPIGSPESALDLA